MFKSKLYKEYYPIKTEEEKEAFIEKQFTKIHETLFICERKNMCSIIDKEKYYQSRLKRPWSIRGNLKSGNILHNEVVLMEREYDYDLKCLQEKENNILALKERFLFRTLTIEDVNQILKKNNSIHHQNIMYLAAFIVLIGLLVFVFI